MSSAYGRIPVDGDDGTQPSTAEAVFTITR